MAILAFLNMLFLKLAGFLLSVVVLFMGTTQPATTIEAKEQNANLQFCVISDVHMESYELFRFQGFSQVLRDIGAAKTKQDALVLLGDNTMNGQPTEYIMLYGLLSQYNKAANTLVAMGNHDLNPGSYETPEAIARHNLFLRSYAGMVNDKPYYSQVINGYTFIVLGDEGPQEDTTATITQAQLDWLEETLKAAPAGKPVFIFLHQQLGHAFGGWGSVGEQSEIIRGIIEQYQNIFIFNGHLHREREIRQIDGVTYINLPCLLSRGTDGIGFHVEVHESKIWLRSRNFIIGEWLEEVEVAL